MHLLSFHKSLNFIKEYDGEWGINQTYSSSKRPRFDFFRAQVDRKPFLLLRFAKEPIVDIFLFHSEDLFSALVPDYRNRIV